MDDPYAVLGLPPDAHEQDVNRVFRALARDLHPERFVGAPEEERATAEARFKEVSAAYAAIKAGREERRTWAPLTPERSLAFVMAGLVLTLGVLLAGVVGTAFMRIDGTDATAALPADALAMISVVKEGQATTHSAVLSVKRLGDYVVVQLDSNEILMPGDLAASCISDGEQAWRTDSVTELSETYVVRYLVPLDADHEVAAPGGDAAAGEDFSFVYACDASYTPAPLAAALFAP